MTTEPEKTASDSGTDERSAAERLASSVPPPEAHSSPAEEDMIDKDQLLALDRPQSVCSECGGTLEDLERHPTCVRWREDQLLRSDFCTDCWEFAKNEAHESFWVTRRNPTEKATPKLSRREKAIAARALFESLWDKRDLEDVDAHLYFLSHLLMRWGGLKWIRNHAGEDGQEFIVFENPATGDPIEVPAVDPDEESIEAIRTSIEDFLRGYAAETEMDVEL